MKTMEEVKSDLKELQAEYEGYKRIPKIIERKIGEMECVIRYLYAKPTVEAVEKQYDETNKSIDILNGRFDLWVKSNPCKNTKSRSQLRAQYRIESGISRLVKQRNTLRYILD
jgi:hypothetical protein